jgi:hypothetical protein
MSEYRINPAFHRFADEAVIVGRLLVAFGELEISICQTAGKAMGAQFPIMKALYRLRATSGRILAADALLRPLCEAFNLIAEYQTTLAALNRCLKIRNTFAHCNWGDDATMWSAGLFYTDLQEAAEASTGYELAWKHVNVPLLTRQESFFAYTLEWIRFVDHELAFRQGRLLSHFWPRPTEQELPPLHNPPAQHIPPWLSEDQKALHVARALAAEGGAPTPTPQQQALEKARAEKRSRREASRKASSKGSSKKSET